MSAPDGLFETVYLRRGVPLRLEGHFARMRRSADALGLPFEETVAEVRRRCESLPDGRLRLVLREGRITVEAHAFPGYDPALYAAGAAAVLAPGPGHPLGERAGHKVLPYDVMIDARDRAEERGALEVLFTDTDGALLEGSVTNLFVVRDGVLVTPPLSRPILPGVTRAAVLGSAEEAGLAAAEADLFPADLGAAQEVFLTSSLMLALPLRRVGDREIPLGPVAARIRALLT
jgi:branched-subunit amino acid aminotransferase/4-amino-4-deoxychorismate lyase